MFCLVFFFLIYKIKYQLPLEKDKSNFQEKPKFSVQSILKISIRLYHNFFKKEGGKSQVLRESD